METDKKTPNNIVYYQHKAVNPDEAGDLYQLVSLLLGIIAFIFKIKWCCWISLIFILSSYVNSKYNVDSKQMMMNFSLIFLGFFMVYMPQRHIPNK